MASGSRDGHIVIWDVRLGKKIFWYKSHSKEVGAIKWSKDGYTLASGGSDKKLVLFDIRTNK